MSDLGFDQAVDHFVTTCPDERKCRPSAGLNQPMHCHPSLVKTFSDQVFL